MDAEKSFMGLPMKRTRGERHKRAIAEARAVMMQGDASAQFYWQNYFHYAPIPIPKADREQCGAKTRQGEPCRRRCVAGRVRCANHGGMSTGPKTATGRAAIAASNRRRAETQNGG